MMGSEAEWMTADFIAQKWESDGGTVLLADSLLILFDVGGWDTRSDENAALVRRVVADHNALANIPDPIAWVEAVERLVEAARPWAELPESLSADDDEALSDAVRAVLALQSPREEEQPDAD